MIAVLESIRVRISRSDKRILGMLIVCILVSAGVLAFVTSYPLSDTFTFERSFNGDALPVRIDIENMKDCELTLEFIDDNALMYRIDVEFYEMHRLNLDFTFRHISESRHYIGLDGSGLRIRSIHVLLGSAAPYDIGFSGGLSDNVTCFATYSNQACLGGTFLCAFLNSTLSFNLTSDVKSINGYAETMLFLGASNRYLDSITLNVDLKDAVNGLAYLRNESLQVSCSGWMYTYDHNGESRYSTNSTDFPRVTILAESHAINAVLTAP
ncbi:MAG: hypothetical protein ACFFED_06635 [Candidatus Thorarchaeota archaeon]